MGADSRVEVRNPVAAADRSRVEAVACRIPEEVVVARRTPEEVVVWRRTPAVAHTRGAVGRGAARSRAAADIHLGWGYPRTARSGCQSAPEVGS